MSTRFAPVPAVVPMMALMGCPASITGIIPVFFQLIQTAACPRTLAYQLARPKADDHHAGFVGLFKGRYLKPLTVGISLMLFQQITGQPSVLYYAADIFNKAGIDAGKDATGVSVILGVFKLVMTGLPASAAGQHAITVWKEQVKGKCCTIHGI